jgi:hypothetical protein
MSNAFDHARLKALAEELGRPMFTLEVLRNDPFTAGQPGRKAGAEWFAQLWESLEIKPGAHLHRIHYLIVSQAEPVLMPNGAAYENTRYCEKILERASLDARYLGLIQLTDLVDRRNEEPIINLSGEEEGYGLIFATGSQLDDYRSPELEIPHLVINPPTILQGHHTEIWIEKTTVDDVVRPLAVRLGVNLVRGAGELSLTRCNQFVDRAVASGRPVRILYVSDFDPGGASMPVAAARKIEYLLQQRDVDLDIQLRPVVLTHEQCAHYRLPRTPLKETEKRAARFEARFGEGGTELDALEALHPGVLARILEEEVSRYHDADLDGRVEETTAAVQEDLHGVTAEVRERHSKAIATLEAKRRKLAAAIKEFQKKAGPVLRRIEQDLEAEAPDIDGYDWPEPADGEEDDDPLFDSTREYVEQINRYKLHQDKPTEAAPRNRPEPFQKTCENCARTFMATRKDASVCSRRCRNQRYQAGR